MKEKMFDKISSIEKRVAEKQSDKSEDVATPDVEVLPEPEEPVEPPENIDIARIGSEIQSLMNEMKRNQEGFELHMKQLQEQLSAKEAEVEQMNAKIRTRLVELNGALKYLKNELL